ncbi:MAG: histidine ammonia-lyase [Psychroflexus sp.]|nr:histidine ammonia-lyase [Psychroflexus sp.]
MRKVHYIDSKPIAVNQFEAILNDSKLVLSQEAEERILKSRAYLDEKQAGEEQPMYGINTGFGSLCNVKISKAHLAQLQENLVLSHACGTGDKVKVEIVRLMMFLKIQSLSYGFSGVSLELVQRLVFFFNHHITPIVYEQGSLGASGDLAPLAHMSLPLIGKGTVYYKNDLTKSHDVLKLFNIKPLSLKSKEGLALLNGTQFMSAHGVWNLIQSNYLSAYADLIGSISTDAFDCNLSPFDELVHRVRPHSGQLKTAEKIRAYLKGSEIANREKENVQDPYSFRCIPQVHGATKDALDYVNKTITTEINAVTDNPNIFVDDDKVISGGNFHGQPLAIALDVFAIAMAELGNISERRIYQLVSGLRGLPDFLVDNPGLNSGFMIPQYTAASIVSQNKQWCTPASVDSIVSSNGQEDHVSMGANAATKLLKVVDNIKTILAIELFNASQALYFRKPLKSSKHIEDFLKLYQQKVPIVNNDILMSEEISKTRDFLDSKDAKAYLKL